MLTYLHNYKLILTKVAYLWYSLKQFFFSVRQCNFADTTHPSWPANFVLVAAIFTGLSCFWVHRELMKICVHSLRARRWCHPLFGNIVDLAVCNAWLLDKGDCVSLSKTVMPLKNFRLAVSWFVRSKRPATFRAARSSPPGASRTESNVTPTIIGRHTLPSVDAIRMDTNLHQLSVYAKARQTCKNCSHHNKIHRSRWMCGVCKITFSYWKEKLFQWISQIGNFCYN